MKVNQSPLDSSGVSQLGRAAGAGSGGTGKGTPVHLDRDRVQLSGLSARLLASADSGTAERTARISQLSADFRAGRYQVDAKELSRRLIDEAMRQ